MRYIFILFATLNCFSQREIDSVKIYTPHNKKYLETCKTKHEYNEAKYRYLYEYRYDCIYVVYYLNKKEDGYFICKPKRKVNNKLKEQI